MTDTPDTAIGAPHERRAQRVNAAGDLRARFIALTGFYGCAQREIAAAPFYWGIDLQHVEWRALMTPGENAVWEALLAADLRFYPQYPVGRFFVDFAHPGAKAVIECDGVAFQRDWEIDSARDTLLAQRGWQVFRIAARHCVAGGAELEDLVGRLRDFVYEKKVSS